MVRDRWRSCCIVVGMGQRKALEKQVVGGLWDKIKLVGWGKVVKFSNGNRHL